MNGLRILKLRLLPEGHALPLLCSEGSALIHGPEILPATLQTVDCPDDNKLGGGLARPKEGGKTNSREEIGCCDPPEHWRNRNCCSAVKMSGRRSSNAEGKPAGISGGTIGLHLSLGGKELSKVAELGD